MVSYENCVDLLAISTKAVAISMTIDFSVEHPDSNFESLTTFWCVLLIMQSVFKHLIAGMLSFFLSLLSLYILGVISGFL